MPKNFSDKVESKTAENETVNAKRTTNNHPCVTLSPTTPKEKNPLVSPSEQVPVMIPKQRPQRTKREPVYLKDCVT